MNQGLYYFLVDIGLNGLAFLPSAWLEEIRGGLFDCVVGINKEFAPMSRGRCGAYVDGAKFECIGTSIRGGVAGGVCL